MNGLLKAMLKGSKREAFTQVDEGELVWYPNSIMNKGNQQYSNFFDQDALSFNIPMQFLQE